MASWPPRMCGTSSGLTAVGVKVTVRSMASESRLTIVMGLPASITSPSMAIRSHWACPFSS